MYSAFSARMMLVFCMAVSTPVLPAQETEDRNVILQKRTRELRERLSPASGAASPPSRTEEEITVEALSRILEEEGKKVPRGALYHRVLDELGRFTGNSVAVQTLVRHIDTGVYAGARLRVDPLEGYTAAEALLRSGSKGRRAILDALGREQSERSLYIMGYVLVELDRDRGDSDVDVTLLRLKKELNFIQSRVGGTETTQVKNLERMIAIIEGQDFQQLTTFPAQKTKK